MFAASVFRFARALAALGIGRGDVVALFARNVPDAIAVRYAATLLGAGASYLSVPHLLEARARLIEDVAPALPVVFPQTQRFVPPDTRIRRPVLVPVAAVPRTEQGKPDRVAIRSLA